MLRGISLAHGRPLLNADSARTTYHTALLLHLRYRMNMTTLGRSTKPYALVRSPFDDSPLMRPHHMNLKVFRKYISNRIPKLLLSMQLCCWHDFCLTMLIQTPPSSQLCHWINHASHSTNPALHGFPSYAGQTKVHHPFLA